tara:strand:+ start:911 stop:1204 length:294 start_codon:yes stop_codon:yes gene_type:complete
VIQIPTAVALYKAIRAGKKISEKFNVPKVIKNQIKSGKISETVGTKMLRRVDELPENVVAPANKQLKLFKNGGHVVKNKSIDGIAKRGRTRATRSRG